MFVLSVRSEPVGLEDGRIPDSSFSASSAIDVAPSARLNHASKGWRPANRDVVEPWLQVDLLFVRLVTGFATHGDELKYLKTYFVSFGFDADRLMVYLDGFKQRKVSITNTTRFSFLLLLFMLIVCPRSGNRARK